MNNLSSKIKYILVAVLAIFLASRMWVSAIDMGANENLRVGFGSVLTLGMQIVAWFGFAVMCLTAFQNLLEFGILSWYKNGKEINDNTRKLVKFTIYMKILASLALRLVFSLLFTVLACVAFFAPGVRNRGAGVYGAGVFMLALAIFMVYANVRVAKARVCEIRGNKEEEE
jgi:hypothetical protein